MSYFNEHIGGDDDGVFNGGSDDDETTTIDDDVEEEESSVVGGGVDDDFEGGGGEEGAEDDEIDDDDIDDDLEKDDEVVEDDDDDNGDEPKVKKVKSVPTKNIYKKPDDFIDDEDDDDDDGEQYLQKFEQSVNDNYILNYHPESVLHNYNEILSMTNVVRNNDGIIIDNLHRTIPCLTKYEKARILGQRAKQINSGAYPFVKVPENVIDGYIIAEMELKQKRIPFIIRRPLPNGGSEYWKVQDLEDISF